MKKAEATMGASQRPVKDIAVSGFGKIDLIGNGLARIWLIVDHVGNDGKTVEHRVRKRPLVMPIKALLHSMLILAKAATLSVGTVDESVVATLTDGDDREIEDRR